MTTDTLVIHPTTGPIRGTSGGGVDVWKGVRYAAPPVGDLRWRRARPPHPHDEVVDADAYGAVAPQAQMPGFNLGPGVVMDEDCLFLNIWTPLGASTGSRPRPVMVWIHGGAYVLGSSSQPLYDAARLVVDGDVVVVSVNYRLGAFGFGDFSSLNEHLDEPRFESNTALSDVLLALTWVRDNIGAFGGNPDNVTVFGESAGAGVVTTLLTMPAAEGLFHKAIAESSPATSMYDHARAARVAAQFLEAADATHDELVGLAVDRVVKATMTLMDRVPTDTPGTIPFAPVIDGDLVPRNPMDVFRDAESLPVPLLIGTNKDEAALFKWMRSPMMPIAPADIERMFATLAAEYPEVTLPPRAQITSAYQGMKPKVVGLGVARDIAFRMPTVWIAQAHSQRAPVFLYRFDWATRMLRVLTLGATHATELPYVFGNLSMGPADITFRLGGRKTGEAVSRRMQRRWTSFAHRGDPAADPTLPWPRFDSATRATLVIDAEDRVVDDLDAELRQAWGDEVLGFR
ncbi:carboxylesterase/lipase family protein [Gordonia sp. CPCC 205515]|uniref:carboxylesterase/lipase family protein n=1 Tax=Gordonia sp. CPCC 205515 TaxID=3140791 RepID=UPI003AF34E8D